MNVFSKIIAACCLLSSLFACSSDEPIAPKVLPDADPIVLNSEFDKKLETVNNFAFNLFKSTQKSETAPNIFLSPYSVDMALSMTWNGADGATMTQMQSVLGNDGYTPAKISEYAKAMREALTKVDATTTMTIANSIWYRSDFAVQQSFVDVNKQNYNATVKGMDFAATASLSEINDWCATNTHNKIPKILDQISPDAVMYLANAIYFKGIWAKSFDPRNTTDQYFTPATGDKKMVKMMSQTAPLEYSVDVNGRYLELPYGNKAFSMVVVLPKEGKTIDDVVQNMNSDSWNAVMLSEENKMCNVTLKLPRFKVECDYEMADKILPDMGMKLAFDSELADFSKISDTKIAVSRVIHKTFLEVDEKGTEAAAATIAEMLVTDAGVSSEPIAFTVDKPFVCVIRERSTGLILFIGKIEDI